ncbi:hypothetical protein FRC02_002700 [Tulasnella sp. 418]|nr:hypothetical protein FRC02_002700 [Tulasnella sp. 418]
MEYIGLSGALARLIVAQDNLIFDAPVIDAMGVDSKSALDAEKGFWEEYTNDSTNLLIFAGLFSAINTAFIVESMKDLKRDQSEATNDLLRILIRNLHDPSAYSPKDIQAPAKFATPKEAAQVNSLFFASLLCALLAALGAVMGKQWLNYYENDGLQKPLPE